MRLKWATMGKLKRLQCTEATNFLLLSFVFPIAFLNHVWPMTDPLNSRTCDFKYSIKVYPGSFTKVPESMKN